MESLLKFGRGNSKLDEAIFTFSLPAGHSCPFALECFAKADRETGKLTERKTTRFRCFAASEENFRREVRRSRWHNLSLLRRARTTEKMADLIDRSMSPFAGIVRVHVSGDYYSQAYFDSWLEVANRRPRALFYGYTKALPFWLARRDEVPVNFVLTASYGGKFDHLIAEHGLRSARVVFSEEEAADLGLEIDHDDSHAMKPGRSFALLLHGPQPKGSIAAKRLWALRQQGHFGYGKRAKKLREQYLATVGA